MIDQGGRTARGTILVVVAGFALACPCADAADALEGAVVHVAYFVPGDREPIPGYVDRMDRVMREVQRFYRDGMASAGYGAGTFRLDRDEQGRLKVGLVRGRQPMSDYGRNDAGALRREVRHALAEAGLDVDGETLVIFEVLLDWRGEKAVEIGPYCGGGNHLSGTAWVYDDGMLDPRRLGSTDPGGYYHRPCSVGEFNSHYIGGVAHELGHAFGLPHACQRKTDRERGTALMGAGNHTYGQELRREGKGTFLTDTSAMMLSQTRAFAGDLENARNRPRSKLTDLEAAFDGDVLTLEGALSAAPLAFGIAAYNDPQDRPGDYDAVGWTAKVDGEGKFKLQIGELRPGTYQLRLRACHEGGTKSLLSFDYEVDRHGKPDVDLFGSSHLLNEAVIAYRQGDRRRLETAIVALQSRFPERVTVQRKAAHLASLLERKALRSASELPSEEKKVAVSDLEFGAQAVGWGRPLRDQVRTEGAGTCFLQVGGVFSPSGLYSHAPSRYELLLGRNWTSLSTSYGLQDGHDGSVVFVIRGDGRELFRSPTIRGHRLREVAVDVSDVDVLELLVENAGDGYAADWGVWIQPELLR